MVLVLGFALSLGGGVLAGASEEPALGYLVMLLGGVVLSIGVIAVGVHIGLQYNRSQSQD